jgi:polar amino acid transport system substrate-binding protein
MHLMLKRILLLSISMLSLVSVSSKAVDSIDDIVWTTENLPPDNYLNEKNELVGDSVDIVGSILKVTGSTKTIKDIKVLPWATAYENALNNKNYALFSTGRTEKREKLFKWAGPLHEIKIVILTKKNNNIRIRSLDEVKQYRIAAVKDDISQQVMNSAVKGLSLSLAANTNDNLLRLNEGTIDLVVADETSLKGLIKQDGFNPDDYESIYTLKEVKLWIAFNLLTSDALVQMVQTALDKK